VIAKTIGRSKRTTSPSWRKTWPRQRRKRRRALFKDEDAYDSDEERKKAEIAKKEAALVSDGKKKPKTGGAKDIDKMWEERIKANKPASSAAQQRIDEIKKSNLSEEAKAQQL